MIKIENVVLPSTEQWKSIIVGMRNPLNSWDKIDSDFTFDAFEIGNNDYNLMKRLNKAGTDHRKFMRMINVYADVIAPRMWWQEFDTYKIGTVANSCSTMHTIHKKEFTLDDFSLDETVKLNKRPEQKQIPIVVDVEIWKELKSIPNVIVSNTGRVKTIPYDHVISDGRVFHYKEKELSVYEDSGYMNVTIRMLGERHSCKLHRLMAEAFIPKEVGKSCVNHKDGNKLNNNLSNLEWVSVSENAQHAQDNSLVFWTPEARESIGRTSRILNDNEILKIIELRLKGYTLEKIKDELKVSTSIIDRVCTGKYFNKRKTPLDYMLETIDNLNELRDLYLKTNNKIYWRMIIEKLPQSYNQKRTILLNYEVLANMYKSRKNHKLTEWITFCDWIKTLPYSELIIGEE